MDHDEQRVGPDLQAQLDRAARVAGTALTLHSYHGEREQETVASCGVCSEACAYVSRLPWGAQACRRSRESAAADAARRGKPIPFICHMGFSCVSMSVHLGPGGAAIMTFGPFCPSEAPDSLERDAIQGLAKLDRTPREGLPFELEDIPIASAEAVPSVAEWLAEDLRAVAQAQSTDAEGVTVSRSNEGTEGAAPIRVHAVSRPLRDPYQASDIVAALAAGDQNQARAITRRLIKDVKSSRDRSLQVRRARAVAVVAAALEAAERAGLSAARAWSAFDGLQSAVVAAEDARALTRAAMSVLGKLKPASSAKDCSPDPHAALNEVLDAHLADGASLEAVAKRLGENPSTLAKRLQRTFGMSFSEYAGRRRVDCAKDLLCRTRLTISQVALRVGISDASNLGKLFRKHEGMSPGDYRKRNAVGASERRSGGKR